MPTVLIYLDFDAVKLGKPPKEDVEVSSGDNEPTSKGEKDQEEGSKLDSAPQSSDDDKGDEA